MTALIQFIVLKRKGKWVVKSKDLERIFSVQQEAVDAAIRFANDSGKEARGSTIPKIEKQIREDLDIWTEPLSAAQIRFTHGLEDAGAGKIGGHLG
jgi:hypothetical protein